MHCCKTVVIGNPQWDLKTYSVNSCERVFFLGLLKQQWIKVLTSPLSSLSQFHQILQLLDYKQEKRQERVNILYFVFMESNTSYPSSLVSKGCKKI